MVTRRGKRYSSKHARRTSEQARESVLGTHVVKRASAQSHTRTQGESRYAVVLARRSRVKRIVTAVVAILIVLAVAVTAGFIAFRGAVGSELSLKESNAAEALVAPKSGEPFYTLVVVELGAIAAPLENPGPDIVLLAQLDSEKKSLAFVNIPATLQVAIDNQSVSLREIADGGDAAFIEAVATYAKVDIAHLVKVDEVGLVDMVDALGGIDIDVEQVIDDPSAGTMYLQPGLQNLDGESALVYLRAENVKLGKQDKLDHQLKFASHLMERLFSAEGNFATRIESIDSFFQTDYTLDGIESIYSWLKGVQAGDIVCETAPGYFTVVTNVTGTDDHRFIGTSSDMAALIEALNGEGDEVSSPGNSDAGNTGASGFAVEVQNGTTVEGAAKVTADLLQSKGFQVANVGNAEQPIYDETLVVYKNGNKAQANLVIDAIGIGRAVAGDSYYSYDADVLVIIGSDYKPVS